MQRRYNLAHLIVASVIVLVLTLMMIVVGAQARIAFTSDRDRNQEIYLMDDDGKNQRNLTNHPDSDLVPTWSPDGTRIAFMSNRDGHVRKDGVRTTFEIYVMDANGENPQNLTNNRADDWSPEWSPDGKRIVFSAERDGHFIGDFEITSSEIYVMDVDGGNEQRLTENRKNDGAPSWSPDGTRIVFSADRKGDWLNYEIYVMDADGGNLQRLTENRDDDGGSSWSPDGQRIAFSSNRNGNRQIYVMDADGGNQQQLTNHPRNNIGPTWFVPAFAVAPAGKKFTIWGRLKQADR